MVTDTVLILALILAVAYLMYRRTSKGSDYIVAKETLRNEFRGISDIYNADTTGFIAKELLDTATARRTEPGVVFPINPRADSSVFNRTARGNLQPAQIKERDTPPVKNLDGIENKPMFNAPLSQNVNTTSPVGPGISLLTGLPIETTHNNMTPFFGGSVKQNTVIERFDSVSKDLPYHKVDKPNTFSDISPQLITGMPAITTLIDTSRFPTSEFKQNEMLMQPIRVQAPLSGTLSTDRDVPKNVDELRTVLNPRTENEGRTVSGQLGAYRGLVGAFKKNGPDTFGLNVLLGGTPVITAPVDPGNVVSARAERVPLTMDYYGSASGSGTERVKTTFSIPTRTATEKDSPMNPAMTIGTSPSRGVFTVEYDSTTTLATLPGSVPSRGGRTNTNIGPIKTTIKETLVTTIDPARNSRGILKESRTGLTLNKLKTTFKEINSENKYAPTASRSLGLGYTVNDYVAPVTNRESEHTEYTPGGVHGQIPTLDLTGETHFKKNTVKTEFWNGGARLIPGVPEASQVGAGRSRCEPRENTSVLFGSVRSQLADNPYALKA